jgi:hypothetical protein
MRYERRNEPLAPRHLFVSRLKRAAGLGLLLVAGMLAIGMAGYAAFEGMDAVDAFVNAAMILSGMGPMGELKTVGGKIFAGCYALASGLVVVITMGMVLAPIGHRFLHSFHIEGGKDD